MTEQEVTLISSQPTDEVKIEKPKEELKQPDFTNVTDAVKVSLKRTTQKRLHLWADDNVTADKPLKLVPKDDLIKDINEHARDSEFLSVFNIIKKYPEKEILFIYLANSEIPHYEYNIITNVETKNQIIQQFKEYEIKLKKEIMKHVIKDVGTWQSLGSENDVNQLNEDQRFRALFEVEIESRFPILGESIKFSNRNVEDVIDGYVDVMPYRQTFKNVERVRVDCPVQVSLAKKNVSIQTTLTFPTNAWTQYEYEYTPPVEVPVIAKKGQPKPKSAIERFLNSDFMAPIYHQLIYNWEVNLYRNDYPKLCVDEDKTILFEKFREIMSFVDVDKNTGKLIASCDWSHFYTGIFLASYVDFAANSILNSRSTRDEVHRAIYGTNPVLIWSSQNSLRPILELESPREVVRTAFCPFNENLVVGGCVNGQIIVWDIKGRLQKKSTEVLTTAQQKYRTIMKRMTSWFKNVKNVNSVHPACVSNLQYGHKASISAIEWLPPQYRMRRNGKIDINDDYIDKPSQQFITTGYDGFICFWDLEFILPESEYKKRVNISKRLGKRLSALNIDVSPLHILNHNLSPIYQLSVTTDNVCNASITSISFNFPQINYENLTNPDNYTKNFTCFDKYKPSYTPDYVPSNRLEAICAFIRGDIGKISWEGYEVDSGADVNVEKAQVQLFKRMHDGPVINILRSSFFDNIFLTVGGCLCALWDSNFLNFPILIFRREIQISTCSWSLCRPGCFHLGLENGTLEVWDLTNKSDEPTFTQSISGKALTVVQIHRLPLQTPVIGIADYRGTFRILEIPKPLSLHSEYHKIQISKIFETAKERKFQFTNWENDWKEQHKKELDERKQNIQRLADERRRALEQEAIRIKKQREKEIEEMKRKALLESKPQPGKYEEWAQKKFDKMQSIHMHNILLKKKGLKREDLVEFLAPLTRISEQKEIKAKKENKLIDMKDKIYDDVIENTFSSSVEIKAVTEVEEKIENREFTNPKEYYENFIQTQNKVLEKIKSFNYDIEFNWVESIRQGIQRRKIIDIGLTVNDKHRDRLKSEARFKSLTSERGYSQDSEGVMIKAPINLPVSPSSQIMNDKEN